MTTWLRYCTTITPLQMQRSRCILSQSERQSLLQCQILNLQQYIQVLKTNITLLNSTIRKCIFDPSHSSQPQKTEYFHHTQDKPMTIQRNKKHRYPRKLGKQKALNKRHYSMDMTQLFGHTSKLLSRTLWEASIHAAIFFNQNRRETFKQYRIKKVYTQFNLSKKPMN